MNDLRKAAEMALNYFEDAYWLEDTEVAIKEALRQALDLQTAIERGTKAWADVPDATEWVDELRGKDTTEVTTEVPCKTRPDAPHGFDRNASHSADRYVCECEGWEPVDNVYISEERVHKSDKSIHEPVDWEAVASDQAMTIAMLKLEKRDNSSWVGLTDEQIYEHRWWDEETAFAVNKELMEKNSAPYAKLDTSDRVLHKEWVGLTRRELDIATLGLEDLGDCYLAIEAKLKEKNGG
jgi:hypothetical protein